MAQKVRLRVSAAATMLPSLAAAISEVFIARFAKPSKSAVRVSEDALGRDVLQRILHARDDVLGTLDVGDSRVDDPEPDGLLPYDDERSGPRGGVFQDELTDVHPFEVRNQRLTTSREATSLRAAPVRWRLGGTADYNSDVPRAIRVLISIVAGSVVAALAVSARSAPNTPIHLPEVLLSRQLMAQASLRVGDLITLAADTDGGRAAQFQVVGAYEPTPDPMRFTTKRLEARLHLPDLIALSADPADPLSPNR